MRDAIRMAADGIHYLVVFDDHSDRPIYLARQRRIASTDQRIICYARDGGCTRPNCLATATTKPPSPTPAAWPGPAAGGTSRLQPEINHAHHPEELLRGNTDPPHNQQE